MGGVEKLDAVKKLCQLLMWDNSELAQKRFEDFESCFESDAFEDESLDIIDPIDTALDGVLSHTDYDEFDLMLVNLQRIANIRHIPVQLNADGGLDFDDPAEFFLDVNNAFAEHGFHVWYWDTGWSSYRVFIAKAKDDSDIDLIAETLGLEFHCADNLN